MKKKINKSSKIEFKLEPSLFKSYRSLCDSKGLDASKRLRKFIEFEISYNSNKKDIIQILKDNEELN